MNKTGFGFLRLPKTEEGTVDLQAVCDLTDRYMELGGEYFDTAYTYLDGQSEASIRDALVRRYPRDAFRLADKLPPWLLKGPKDCRKIFAQQLERCGVSYFDVYLIHGMDQENYEICEKFGVFEFMAQLKAAGRARQIGFSFHDDPELLDQILTRHPEMDLVQLQINYLDWDSPSVQSGACYDLAVKHRKKVIVMEPVKGGTLAELPEKEAELLRKAAPDRSPASWAIRFAAQLPQAAVVLSGMNALVQVEENMKETVPLSPREQVLLMRVAGRIRQNTAVACTGCAYCTETCPMGINIPRIFAMYNEVMRHPQEDWKIQNAYKTLVAKGKAAGDCIGCGQCEKRCPQKLPIRSIFPKVSRRLNDFD